MFIRGTGGESNGTSATVKRISKISLAMPMPTEKTGETREIPMNLRL
jgi:hypothetical protein